MGSGKTTIGKQVAELLNYSFVDTDSLIEEKMTLTVADIFLKFGEKYFRKIEEVIVDELLCVDKYKQSKNRPRLPLSKNRPRLPFVIATGGGIILSDFNRNKLVNMGFVVYLNATSSCLIQNLELAKDDRPLLSNVDKKDKIEQLLAERKSLYEIADFEIVVDNKSILEISKNIVDIYSKRKKYGKM